MAKGIDMCKWECTNCFNIVEAKYSFKLPRICSHCNKLGEFKPIEEKVWRVPVKCYVYIEADSKTKAKENAETLIKKTATLEISEVIDQIEPVKND